MSTDALHRYTCVGMYDVFFCSEDMPHLHAHHTASHALSKGWIYEMEGHILVQKAVVFQGMSTSKKTILL